MTIATAERSRYEIDTGITVYWFYLENTDNEQDEHKISTLLNICV